MTTVTASKIKVNKDSVFRKTITGYELAQEIKSKSDKTFRSIVEVWDPASGEKHLAEVGIKPFIDSLRVTVTDRQKIPIFLELNSETVILGAHYQFSRDAINTISQTVDNVIGMSKELKIGSSFNFDIRLSWKKSDRNFGDVLTVRESSIVDKNGRTSLSNRMVFDHAADTLTILNLLEREFKPHTYLWHKREHNKHCRIRGFDGKFSRREGSSGSNKESIHA